MPHSNSEVSLSWLVLYWANKRIYCIALSAVTITSWFLYRGIALALGGNMVAPCSGGAFENKCFCSLHEHWGGNSQGLRPVNIRDYVIKVQLFIFQVWQISFYILLMDWKESTRRRVYFCWVMYMSRPKRRCGELPLYNSSKSRLEAQLCSLNLQAWALAYPHRKRRYS